MHSGLQTNYTTGMKCRRGELWLRVRWKRGGQGENPFSISLLSHPVRCPAPSRWLTFRWPEPSAELLPLLFEQGCHSGLKKRESEEPALVPGSEPLHSFSFFFFFFPHAYSHLPNGFLLTSLCSWPTMSSGGTNCQHLFIFLVYSHKDRCLFFMIRGFIAFLWGEQAAALDFNVNITIPRPGQNRQELKGWLSPLEVLSGKEKFLSACVEDLQKSFKSWRLQYAPLRLSQTCSELEIKRRVGICHLKTNCVLKAAVD